MSVEAKEAAYYSSTGTFSAITWTNPVFENYYVFTIGVEGQAVAVPEPGALALLALGLAGLGFSRRRH
jgi:hypothetical protein